MNHERRATDTTNGTWYWSSIYIFTAGIIAEIGQMERFDDETKIAKYSNLYWLKHQSGRFTSYDTLLLRNGYQYLRYYLVEDANSVRRQIPELSDYHTKKTKFTRLKGAKYVKHK